MTNWDAVGAIAELVGAGAVVLTLVYLALQTRATERVMRGTAIWDAQMSFVAINETLAAGGTRSDIGYRVLSDPASLSDYERHLFHRYVRGFFQRIEAQFALYRNGILDSEVWELRRQYAGSLMTNAVVRECWELDKGNAMFTKAFIEAVEESVQLEAPRFMGVGD